MDVHAIVVRFGSDSSSAFQYRDVAGAPHVYFVPRPGKQLCEILDVNSISPYVIRGIVRGCQQDSVAFHCFTNPQSTRDDVLMTGSPSCDALPSCRICSSLRLEYVTDLSGHILEVSPERWRMLACGDCGFASIDPLPDSRALRNAYPSDYYSFLDFEGTRPVWFKRLKAIVFRCYYQPGRNPLAVIFGRLFHRAFNAMQPVPPLTFLDVGCGSGQDVALYRDAGWDAYGVEMNPDAVAVGRRKGLSIFAGDIADRGLPLPPGFFGAVQMGHSLEHVLSPLAVLTRLREVMRPGGRLLIIVPNAAGADFSLFRECWNALMLPQHVNHFSSEALQRLLVSSGFSIERISGMSMVTGRLLQNLTCMSSKLAQTDSRRYRRTIRVISGAFRLILLKSCYSVLNVTGLRSSTRHFWCLKVQARKPLAPALPLQTQGSAPPLSHQ